MFSYAAVAIFGVCLVACASCCALAPSTATHSGSPRFREDL